MIFTRFSGILRTDGAKRLLMPVVCALAVLALSTASLSAQERNSPSDTPAVRELKRADTAPVNRDQPVPDHFPQKTKPVKAGPNAPATPAAQPTSPDIRVRAGTYAVESGRRPGFSNSRIYDPKRTTAPASGMTPDADRAVRIQHLEDRISQLEAMVDHASAGQGTYSEADLEKIRREIAACQRDRDILIRLSAEPDEQRE